MVLTYGVIFIKYGVMIIEINKVYDGHLIIKKFSDGQMKIKYRKDMNIEDEIESKLLEELIAKNSNVVPLKRLALNT